MHHRSETPQIDAFAQEARAFAVWATEGNATQITPEETLRILMRLYSAGVALPVGWTEDGDPGVPGVEVSESDLKSVADRITQLPVRYYAQVFDPFERPVEPVTGDLVEDLKDIYVDVVRGFVLFERGQRAAAHWQWSYNFWVHWGEHALSAMRALHWHLAQEGGPWER